MVVNIKFFTFVGRLREKFKNAIKQKSGGKVIIRIKTVSTIGGSILLVSALLMSWFAPKEDKTFYRHTNHAAKASEESENSKPPVTTAMNTLFQKGQKQKEDTERKESEEKRKKVSIRYFAPQVLGNSSKGPVAFIAGSKLIGVLLNAIDTRTPSLVRVRITQEGEVGGIIIAKDSVLMGKFSYSGSGEKVFINFTRLNSPEGESKKIAAQALDASNYTPGILGEEFTGNGVKIAASIGLNMFAGITDTLTDRESVGNTLNGVQARPTMKNALLQGLTRASQDQASRVASTINNERGYVIVPEGKEVIIELTEDFKK